MGLSIGPSVTADVRPKVDIDVRVQIFTERLALLQSLHGVNYSPEARCPGCRFRLSVEEILAGFRPDPNDFDTTCPRCENRFEPQLIYRDRISRGELPFYCGAQTLAKLPSLVNFEPERIRREHQDIFHSALVHFGGLKAAFDRAKISYLFDEKPRDWRQKVEPFLGCLPDTVIARCVNMSSATIGRLRRSQGIERFGSNN